MVKLLVFCALFFGILYFFYYKIKKFFLNLFHIEDEQKNEKESPKINKGEMVKCPVCGTYFPENSGVKRNGKLFCSIECANKR